MPATQVNLRIDPELLAKIDANANQQGVSRTDYLLQWLPETHEPHSSSTHSEQHSKQR